MRVHRQEREKQRQQTGKPVELIWSCVDANVGPVPEVLGVSPFYKKYADAQGIPVLASGQVPDAALLVARDIVNTMLAARPDLRKALIAASRWVFHGKRIRAVSCPPKTSAAR